MEAKGSIDPPPLGWRHSYAAKQTKYLQKDHRSGDI